MRGVVKFSVVFISIISLFLSCSFLLLNAQAQTSLEKVNLGDNSIRIQTDKEVPVIDLELLENTDQCLVDCYAVLKIHPYQDVTFPESPDSEFDWKFVKAKPWMEGLVSYHFEILETTEYQVEIPDYENVLVKDTCYGEENTTYECEIEKTVQTGSHEETRYRQEYRPFNFWGETLKANQDHMIKMVGKKRAQLGTNNIDWIPVMKGLEINEWDWWNMSWQYKKRLNVTENSANDLVDYPVVYENFDCEGHCNDSGKDIRVVYDDGTTESLAFGLQKINSSSYNITFKLSVGASSTNSSIYVYYGNPSATAVNSSWNTVRYNWFDDFSTDTGLWSESDPQGVITVDTSTDHRIEVNNLMRDTSDLHALYRNETISNPDDFIYIINVEQLSSSSNDCQLVTSFVSDTFGLLWPTIRQNGNAGGFSSYGAGGGNYDWRAWNITSGVTGLSDLGDFSEDTEYELEYVRNGSHSVYKIDGTAYATRNTPTGSWDHIYVVLNSDDGGIGHDWDGYLDDVRIRKYIHPEPSLSLGAEEVEVSSCPTDDTYINDDTKFEPANLLCSVNDSNNNGIIIINASNIILDCNGMILEGNSSGKAIKILGGDFDNITIKNCEIRNYDLGIYFSSNDNHTIFNNTIFGNNKGVFLFYSNDNNLSNNIIRNQSAYGILIGHHSNRNILANNNISFNENIGLILMWSNDTWIYNNKIKDNGPYDIRIGDIAYDENQEPSVNNTFLNTTFDSVHMMNNGELERQWYLMVNVTDRNFYPLENAEVSVFNNSDKLEWTENTSANGLTGWNTVIQYVQRNESGTMEFINHTPHSISANHPNYSTNSTTQNIDESKIVHIVLSIFNITFNVTSGETGQPIDDLDNIICNYTGFSFNASDDENPYGPYEFPPGGWWCKFIEETYFNKTIIFSANSDKNVSSSMSLAGKLTQEEHDWLEWLYDCWNSGYCVDLLEQIGLETAEINETTNKIWNQFKRTDQTIVTNESFISKTVNSTNNITINYTVNVPTKEGYGLIEGIQGYDDFLPIRIHYWFIDENNESCYSQGNYSITLAEPYCQPLTIYTVGQINTQINFTVDLRPNLPTGIYYIVRNLEIDPDNVWIDYGQEIIGQVVITEDSMQAKASARSKGKIFEEAESEGQKESNEMPETQQSGDMKSGMTTVYQIDNFSYLAVIISIITLILVSLIYRNSRKRTF